MASRSLRWACTLACAPLLGLVAARAEPAASPQAAGHASVSSSLSAYRAYASDQAEMLVRMTKVLARDIRSGDVEAAQNDYAMAHRYLERIAPAAATLDGDRERRMDAHVEDEAGKPLDAGVSGFHRIEHDLFAARSTSGLSFYADRLHDDAIELQRAIATRPMAAAVLIDGAAATIETVSARTLAGGSEPYARTDLWDIEANLEGTREIVTAARPLIEAHDPLLMARLSNALAAADTDVAQYKAGCGFKSFDELTRADKASLRATTLALSRELSKLRAVPEVD